MPFSARRRALLAALSALGVIVSVLVACGGDDTVTPPPPPSPEAGPIDAGVDAAEASPDTGPPPLVCTAPLADCDGQRDDGCEVHLDRDPKNCGACGLSCGGAACVDGTCAPETIFTTYGAFDALAITKTAAYVATPTSDPNAGDGVTRVPFDRSAPSVALAAKDAPVQALAATDDRLVALRGYALVSAPIDAIAAAGESHPVPSARSPLAVVGDAAYVATAASVVTSSAPSTTVIAASLPDGAFTNLAPGMGQMTALVAGPGALYGASPSSGEIERIPFDGSPARAVVTQIPNVTYLAIDAARLYWGTFKYDTDGEIASAPIGGGPRTVLVDHVRLASMTANTTSIFYVADEPVDGGAPVRRLYGVRKSGGPPRALATLPSYGGGLLAATDDHVVFSSLEADGGYASLLERVPALDGGPGPAPTPAPVACDATHLDCNHDPADGCESDVTTDGAHCGACGHSCREGLCAASTCGETVSVAYVGASTFDLSGYAATDGHDVYMVLAGSSGSVPTLFRRSTTGGPIVPVGPAPKGGQALAVDADRVYLIGDSASVYSMPKSGPSTPTLLGAANDHDAFYPKLVVRGGFVYWMTQTQVWRVPVAGGSPPASIASTDRLEDFDVDDASVYLAVWPGSLPHPGVWVGPNDGSAATTLLVPAPSYDDGVAPTAVRVDADHVYFATYGGEIDSATKAGSNVTTLKKYTQVYPWYEITATDAAIYVNTAKGFDRVPKSASAPAAGDGSTAGGLFVVTPDAFAYGDYGLAITAR